MLDTPPRTALIVIADEGKRAALDQSLRHAGFIVQVAANGADGLRSAMEIPDIIVLDHYLPDMNGFEVCSRLKVHAATAVIPVLHLADYPVERSEFDTHLERGDEVFLTHPVEAIELQTSVISLPNVVLLDLGLPGLNGFEVAKRLRQQPVFQNVVLVAMTGYGQEADRQHSFDAGFDHHLVKPAAFGKVQEILATVSTEATT